MSKPSKVKPAPVPFPNGGGIRAMSGSGNKRQALEREALAKQHEVELAKLAEKHANENKPKVGKSKNVKR